MFEISETFCQDAPVLRFAKYQGLGNDFIVISRLEGNVALDAGTVRALCDRHRGVGADGVLTLWPDAVSDGRMQVQNADGSDTVMCGNGLRCLARYLHDEEIVASSRREVTLRAGTQTYPCTRISSDVYRVAMGAAIDEHPDLPNGASDDVVIEVGGRQFGARCLWLGNPHAVIFSDESDPLDLAKAYGGALESHRVFRNRANITFARATDDGFDAAVHERGVGLTEACGSAACALGAAAVRKGLWGPSKPMQVRLPGGNLTISVDASGRVTMEGPAVRVFEGEVGS
ncbi:MAG: diaminopimelate epimerase [Myxococcota bacterium]